MKKTSLILMLSIVLILTVVLSACGGSKDGNADSGKKEEASSNANNAGDKEAGKESKDGAATKRPYEGVTLKAVLIGGGLYEEMYKNIPKFEQKTGAKVDIVFKGNHFDLDKKIKLDFASNTVDFDVFSNHSSFYTQYLDAAEPLNAYFSKEELADFMPNILDKLTKNGNLYIIPRHADISMFLYRKDLFDDEKNKADYKQKTGKDLKVPETWDEFNEIALWWGNRNGVYATQFAGKEEALSGRFLELLEASGGKFLNDDLTKVAFNGTEGVKVAQMLQDLYKAKAMPSGMVNFLWDEVAKNFANGTILMYTDWYGWYEYFQDPENSKVAGKIDIARQPKGASGKHSGWSGAHGFSIAKASKNKEAAAALIKFLTSEQVLYEESSKGYLAVRNSVADKLVEDAKASGDPLKVKKSELAKVQIGEDFATPPLVPSWIPMSNALFPQLQRIILGDTSAQDGLNKAAEEAQKALDSK